MNKRIVYLFGVIISILVISLPFLLIGLVRRGVDVEQPVENRLARVYGKQIVGQSFQSNRDNLKTVVLYLKNTSLQNSEDIIFYLSEYGKHEENIREVVLNGKNIGDGETVRIDFTPIPNSKSQRYFLYLESTSSTKENGIEVGYSKDDEYFDGQAFINDDFFNGDLFLLTYYTPQPLQLIKDGFTGFLYRLSQDLVFTLPFFVIVSLLGISIVWFLKTG